MASDPLVRPEYGPSLPAWLEAHLGVPRRATLAGALGLLAVAAVVVVVLVSGSSDARYVRQGQPVFNLRYAADALRPAPGGSGATPLLDAHRGGKFVQSFAVRRLV